MTVEGPCLLSRLTLTIEDTSVNYNLATTAKEFDILAVRPTSEKTLQYACAQMDIDIVSLDLSVRLPYYLKHSTLGSAVSRGVYIEICYSAGMADTSARRNLISNASNLVRATRGRGLIVSSEASSALSVRGPYDLINLATFWGLSQEKGQGTINESARKVIVKAQTRKGVHKGVLRITQQPDVNVLHGVKRAAEAKPQDGKLTKSTKKPKKAQREKISSV